jgi:hypothetical protein
MAFPDYFKVKQKLKKINFNLHYDTFQEVLYYFQVLISVKRSLCHHPVHIS